MPDTDATELQASGSVKIAGATGTNPGAEDNYLDVDASGRITVKLDDGSGNAITSEVSGVQTGLDVVQNAKITVALNNATVTSNGSALMTGAQQGIASLIVNIKNAPTGTNPTLYFTLTEVDPIDGTTQVGSLQFSKVYSAISNDTVEIKITKSASVKLSWTISGAGASFTGVNVSLVQKASATNPDMEFGSDGRLRTSQESLLFVDAIDGSAINTNLWVQSQSGMTQAVSAGKVTLNAASSTVSGNYSIITSAKYFTNLTEFPLYAQFQASVTAQTNSVIEFGFGYAATNAAPTDGVFLRIDSTGTAKLVLSFGGTETLSNPIPSLVNGTVYLFEIVIREDSVSLSIQDQQNAYSVDLDIDTPNTQGSPVQNSRQPIFARVYNSGTPGSAAQLLIDDVVVVRQDLVRNKPWGETQVDLGNGGYTDPSTYVQTANYANSAAPATATLSNTTPSYTTLGGQFTFVTVAGSETDYALFAYQVPAGFSFHVTDVIISARAAGSANTNAITCLEWGLGVNSSGASLATGAPNPPMRVCMGLMSNEINALVGGSLNLGNLYTPSSLTFQPKTPLVCDSSRYVHIIVKVSVGSANANQQVRGMVSVLGYFE